MGDGPFWGERVVGKNLIADSDSSTLVYYRVKALRKFQKNYDKNSWSHFGGKGSPKKILIADLDSRDPIYNMSGI